MKSDPHAELERIRAEVKQLRANEEGHRRRVGELQARRDAAEREVRELMARLAAFDEQEKALQAKFLNDPFWDGSAPVKKVALPEVRLARPRDKK